ncbi:hypothetical protein WJX84_005146 [Apatococcus fuscideae]|uniref:Uncharacterized protein n=1 Tax=Apatococcus fuscideae TaxID=2026836 RepID=A0AAW1T141_9CHLO
MGTVKLLGDQSGRRDSHKRSPKASQQLALATSVLVIGCSTGALFGFASGWTRYYSESFSWQEPSEGTPDSFDVRQGWWKGSSITQPGLFNEDPDPRGFGMACFVASSLLNSTVCALMVLLGASAALLGVRAGYASKMLTAPKFSRLYSSIQLFLYFGVVALYASLALSLRQTTKEQLGVALLPRPDWAAGLGLLAAIGWTLISIVHADLVTDAKPVGEGPSGACLLGKSTSAA